MEADLQRVGGTIQPEGFPAEAYLSFEHAVLRAVRGLHAGDWSSRLSADWVAYLTWLIAHLRIGAAAAASPVTTSPLGVDGPPARPPARATAGVLDCTTPTSSVDSALAPVVNEAGGGAGSTEARPLRVGQHARKHTPVSSPAKHLQQAVDAPLARSRAAPVAEGAGIRRPEAADPPSLALEQLLTCVRERYFPHGARASRCPAEAREDAAHLAAEECTLDAMCAAVAARTGVDLKAPHPEQHFDHMLIGRVVETLQQLGYTVAPDSRRTE